MTWINCKLKIILWFRKKQQQQTNKQSKTKPKVHTGKSEGREFVSLDRKIYSTLSLSTQMYEWVLAVPNCKGNLTKHWANPCGLSSHSVGSGEKKIYSTLSLSTQVYEWVLAMVNRKGNLTKHWEDPPVDYLLTQWGRGNRKSSPRCPSLPRCMNGYWPWWTVRET